MILRDWGSGPVIFLCVFVYDFISLFWTIDKSIPKGNIYLFFIGGKARTKEHHMVPTLRAHSRFLLLLLNDKATAK